MGHVLKNAHQDSLNMAYKKMGALVICVTVNHRDVVAQPAALALMASSQMWTPMNARTSKTHASLINAGLARNV